MGLLQKCTASCISRALFCRSRRRAYWRIHRLCLAANHRAFGDPLMSRQTWPTTAPVGDVFSRCATVLKCSPFAPPRSRYWALLFLSCVLRFYIMRLAALSCEEHPLGAGQLSIDLFVRKTSQQLFERNAWLLSVRLFSLWQSSKSTRKVESRYTYNRTI